MRYDNEMFRRAGRWRKPGHGSTWYGDGMGRRPHGPRDQVAREYDRDYWWLGERELERRGMIGGYDEAYRRFGDMHRPRYSPVGGMYGSVGGGYAMGRAPRPLREPTWFSDWTRWF